jgi:hypothetical protein
MLDSCWSPVTEICRAKIKIAVKATTAMTTTRACPFSLRR